MNASCEYVIIACITIITKQEDNKFEIINNQTVVVLHASPGHDGFLHSLSGHEISLISHYSISL